MKGLRSSFDKRLLKLCQTRAGNKFLSIPAPHAVGIELTSRCNLSCVMCALHSEEASKKPGRRELGHMEFELFKTIIEEVVTFPRTPDLGLNFAGEPFLYPHFSEAVTLLKRKGLSQKAGFNTNGNLMEKSIADMLLESYEGRITVSMDGLKDSHERIRVGSSYDTVVDNLMYLVDRRKSLGLSKPSIAVNLVRVSQTEREVQEFIDYWVPLVDSVKIYIQLSPDNRLVNSNEYLDTMLAGGRRQCRWPFLYLGIMWNGGITFCCHDILGVGGNISANARDHSLMDIWRGSDFRKLRDSTIAKQLRHISACRACEAWPQWYIEMKEDTENYRIRHNGTGITYRRKVDT